MSKKSYVMLGSLMTLSVAPAGYAGDYFLTMPQKQELIWRGQLHDEQQRLYDIWIVTGYAVPLRHVKQGWNNAGQSLADYGKPSLYDDIKKYSDNTWRYATKDVLKKYTIKGVSKAWQNDIATAQQRTQQRVFGWWLAYPWGVFEATIESAVRIATGVPTGLVLSAAAYTVTPALTFAWPSVESIGYATIEGTAYPLAASAWNTVIAPPLALLGQQPAPERADGFWMKQVDDPNLQVVADVVRDWQRQLLIKSPLPEALAIKDKKEQIQQLHQQIKRLEQQLKQDEQEQQSQQIKELLLNAQQQKPQLEVELQSKGLSLDVVVRNRQALKVMLSDLGLSYENLDKLLDVLTASAPNTPERQTDDKTDPLQRSLDIMQGR